MKIVKKNKNKNMRILNLSVYVIIAKMLFWLLKPSNLIYILKQLLLQTTLYRLLTIPNILIQPIRSQSPFFWENWLPTVDVWAAFKTPKPNSELS